MGSNWGINRTMAQVHALLLISKEPLCADDIMELLKISRGNANMNIRALIDWGLVYKELKPGERREYFVSENDMWVIVRQIITHRKKKELEPVLKILDDVQKIEGEGNDRQDFLDVIQNIQVFADRADRVLDKFATSDSTLLLNLLMKIMA